VHPNIDGYRGYFIAMRKRRDPHLVDLDDRLTVTIERTGEMLDVGRSTVYELLRTGRLKGAKFGRAHRVVVQSIRDLVAESSARVCLAGKTEVGPHPNKEARPNLLTGGEAADLSLRKRTERLRTKDDP
jgi:excisionase family DNA binding protein